MDKRLTKSQGKSEMGIVSPVDYDVAAKVCVTLLRRGKTCIQAMFDVGENAQGLSIKFAPENAFPFALVVLFDPCGALRYNKWLRNGESPTIGRDSAHTGFGGVPGAIDSGKWTLRMFAPEAIISEVFTSYENPKAVVCVCETVPDEPLGDDTVVLEDLAEHSELREDETGFVTERTKWYKGDFHAHTRLSDGKESVASAVEKAKRMDLDFYTATDHNTIHTSWPRLSPLMLPGMEVTSERGHFNIIGLKEPPSNFFEPENMDGGFVIPERMNAILKENARRGAVNSMNHPFLCEWKWDVPEIPLALFHTIEIICDPTYPFSGEANERALAFWTRLWNHGNKIYGLGGSDSHNLEHERYEGASEPSIPGDPASWVHCESLNRENLVHNVKAGHVWVCRGEVRLYPKFSMDEASFLPGDRIYVKNGVVSLNCSLYAEGAPNGTRAQWIVNGEIQEETPLTETVKVFRVIMDASRYTWVRVDIRDANGALYGFVNPVWWGNKPDGFRTFAQAAEGIKAVAR